jgi:glutamate--cysteine ligase
MITSKEHIIDYFKAGIKDPKNFKIGIEHEKFLFNINDNTRVDYSKIKQMFSALAEFGWKPVYEKENIVALNNGGKNITLEPGNQIELSGDILNHIHEACAESQDYLFELKTSYKKIRN